MNIILYYSLFSLPPLLPPLPLPRFNYNNNNKLSGGSGNYGNKVVRKKQCDK